MLEQERFCTKVISADEEEKTIFERHWAKGSKFPNKRNVNSRINGGNLLMMLASSLTVEFSCSRESVTSGLCFFFEALSFRLSITDLSLVFRVVGGI